MSDDGAQGSGADEIRFCNARLVLANDVVTGSLLVRDGVIAAIDEGAASIAGAIDCEGDYLSPGLIELHTDNLERHLQPRPGVKWPRAAAIIAHDAEFASVGVTTVFDALRVGSIVTNSRTRYGKYARQVASDIIGLRDAGVLRISHFIHLRSEICSETLSEELAEFGPADRIGIVSVMDHTPGQRQFANTAQLRVYLKGKFDMTDELIDDHIAFRIGLKDRVGDAHLADAIASARRFGAILASHDDTTAEHAAQSAAFDAVLAEFPTTMEAAAASREHGVAVMMGAPNLIRGGSHSGNVAAADLAAAGYLDILSSDYAPASLMAAAVSLGETSGDMALGIRTVTSAPARTAGLDDRGELQIGARADLLRFAIRQGHPVQRGLWRQGQRIA